MFEPSSDVTTFSITIGRILGQYFIGPSLFNKIIDIVSLSRYPIFYIVEKLRGVSVNEVEVSMI